MDPVVMIYYGIICGCLGMVSPQVNPRGLRFVLGTVVGLVAAALLPALRRAAGL